MSNNQQLPRGSVRDAIVSYLTSLEGDASTDEITRAVSSRLGVVPHSSVRSYLNGNTPFVFTRTGRGRYRIASLDGQITAIAPEISTAIGKSKLYNGDCFSWLASREDCSVHAVVTDPPYGLIEYTDEQLGKLACGKGGVWRVPPSFDGNARSPLPRFTVLKGEDRAALRAFFVKFASNARRVLVPGANVVVATNPLLSHIVADALAEGGLEIRGSIARLTMTMRGGDRPKNAHEEFNQVSVMPRSQWEPWVIARKPLEGRVQDNLRKWRTGGFRRISDEQPFGDVIVCKPTQQNERRIAPHPSLKPQAFMRKVVRASLPLGEGIILDPFAGSGATLAAANHVGYRSIGVEINKTYYDMAKTAVVRLAEL